MKLCQLQETDCSLLGSVSSLDNYWRGGGGVGGAPPAPPPSLVLQKCVPVRYFLRDHIFFQLAFMLAFFRILNDDFWRIPPPTSYIWKSPPGSLPVQSTNVVSHLLSYNKALINQLLGSMLKNIRTSALCTDLTPFRPYVRAAVRIFFSIDRAIGE